MKLSTKGRYGIKAMLHLAERYQSGPQQIREIAKHQDISAKYLEQLIAILKMAGLVNSVRGSKGGYVLAKKPSQIKLNEIFVALEGPTATTECVVNESCCVKTSDCVARQLWVELQNTITSFLESLTLEDLVDKSRKRKGLNYQI